MLRVPVLLAVMLMLVPCAMAVITTCNAASRMRARCWLMLAQRHGGRMHTLHEEPQCHKHQKKVNQKSAHVL